MHRLRLGAARSAPALAILASAVVPVVPASGGELVHVNGELLREILERAWTERVDIVGVGDSNQLFGGEGWDHGMHVALPQHFDMYATGLLTQGENGSNGKGVGYQYGIRTDSDWRTGVAGTHIDAPPEWELFCAPYENQTAFEDVHNYTWSPPDIAFDNAVRNGIRVDGDCPLDTSARLIGSVCYARMATIGDGSFQPVMRLCTGGDLALPPRVNTESSLAPGMFVAQMGIPADPARAGVCVDYRFQRANTAFRGAVFTLYERVENADREHGYSYHTWGSHGGESSRYFANLIVNNDEGVTDEYKQYYFEQVRRLQQIQSQDRRTVIFWINHGMNDRNEVLPSVGPGQYPDGDSPEAYADNLLAAMTQITEDWTAAGGLEEEVWFVLDPAHPIATPEDPELESYRVAAAELARTYPRTAMIDVSSLITADEMESLGYFDPGGPYHLTRAGYEALAQLKVDAFMNAVPPDAFAFAPPESYAAGDVSTGIDAADVDSDGFVDLVVSNRGSHDVVVLRNAGDGTFGGQQSFAVGAEPRAVVAADFDGDCGPDLATANWAANSVTTLVNTGSGSYAAGQTIDLEQPEWLGTADFDADGWPDLAVAHLQPGGGSTDPAALSILMNDGSGVLVLDATYEVGALPRDGAVADFDGNGTPDVAVCNLISGSVSVFGNDGTGLFAPLGTFATDFSPQALAAADFDADGDTDVVVVHGEIDEMRLYLNAGDGSFAPSGLDPWPLHKDPRSVVAVDLDGDGDVDVAVAHVGEDVLDVFANDGTGMFVGQSEASTGRPAHVIAVDVDGDEAIDLATADSLGNSATVYRNETTQAEPPAMGCPGDVDGDGTVAVSDLLAVLAGWGPCPAGCSSPCAPDTNGDFVVDVSDLLIVLGAWGDCP